MAEWRWSTTASRWLAFDFSPPTSIFRWPRLLSSYFTLSWTNGLGLSGFSPRWAPRNLRDWWPVLDFSIVDSVVWSVVTAVESVVLVSMLCFFFLFCGCTI